MYLYIKCLFYIFFSEHTYNYFLANVTLLVTKKIVLLYVSFTPKYIVLNYKNTLHSRHYINLDQNEFST